MLHGGKHVAQKSRMETSLLNREEKARQMRKKSNLSLQFRAYLMISVRIKPRITCGG